MLSMKRAVLLLILMVVGCTGLGGADSPSSYGPRCDSEEDGKRWDLGTGSAYDARRFAPGFLSLRDAGWKEPLQGWPVEQARVDKKRFDKANERRFKALWVEASGIEQKLTMVDDIQAFDVLAPPVEPYRIRRFTVRDQPAILITPGVCPHVYATDTCRDDRLKTTITTEGTVKCVGPFTVSDKVLIAMSEDGEKVPMELGKPLLADSHAPTFWMFSMDGQPLGKAERKLNDFSDALPQEVLAALDLADERPAAQLMKNVPAGLLTDAVKDDVKNTRIESTKKAAEGVDSPKSAIALAGRPSLNTLPGDEEVRTIVRTKVIEVAKLIDDPTPENWKTASNFVRAIKFYGGTDADVASTGLDNVFGPRFVDGSLNDPKAQNTFISAFPDSPHTAKLQERLSQEIELNNAEERAKEAEAQLDYDFAGLAEKADQIVTTRWQASFVLRNLNMMRNRRRSQAGAEAFRKEADRLQREEFCPALREFKKKWGPDYLKPRVKERCENEAPIVQGEFGRQVTLDKECRAIFASGC